jgi:RNA polymerase sigma factor (sigma-70 family)
MRATHPSSVPPALLAADRHRLVRAAARLLGPAEAEDAVQDAYVRALEVRALEARVLTADAGQAWLLTVTRHLAIDRLRRRRWMQQWLAQAMREATPQGPAAETDATLQQESARALRLLATRLPPADGALLLLHAVFEADHAEIARASGKTETASRQQLRRALRRLRQTDEARPKASTDDMPASVPSATPAEESETTPLLRTYLQALRLRDPQALWALLRQPPIHATASDAHATATSPAAPRTQTSVLAQVGGQLGLVLTLDGVTLCVLPLGARAAQAPQTVEA